MYMYNYRGSRSYAKKLALIFTDGLMPEGNLIAEANTLKSISTIAMVGIGTSVQHSLLDKLATNETVLSPNAERIWGYLQMRLARPSCLGMLMYNLNISSFTLLEITFFNLIFD